MSMQLSDPTNGTGIVEKIDDLCGSSSDSYPLARKVRDINLGLDRVFSLIFSAAGSLWNFDDSNHTDLPFIETALVQGQRDYKFLEDGDGNLVLEFKKAFIRQQDSNGQTGTYMPMDPVDPESEDGLNAFWDGKDVQAISTRYAKNGPSILLENPPGYSQDNSLKLFIDREASYFSVSDTTKKPGFAGLYHKYLALYAAHEYAESNQLTVAAQLQADMTVMEGDITNHYGNRARDERPKFKQRITKFK